MSRVNSEVSALWPALEARDKLAFFAVDIERRNGAPPLVWFNFSVPDGVGATDAADRVRHAMHDLADELRTFIASLPPASEG
jgi:hypothetical protein